MKLHGGPNLVPGPEFDTHGLECPFLKCPTSEKSFKIPFILKSFLNFSDSESEYS